MALSVFQKTKRIGITPKSDRELTPEEVEVNLNSHVRITLEFQAGLTPSKSENTSFVDLNFEEEPRT